MDQIEKSLQEISEKLTAAWTDNRCLACPIAELAALAAATLTFYRERNNRPWWTNEFFDRETARRKEILQPGYRVEWPLSPASSQKSEESPSPAEP